MTIGFAIKKRKKRAQKSIPRIIKARIVIILYIYPLLTVHSTIINLFFSNTF